MSVMRAYVFDPSNSERRQVKTKAILKENGWDLVSSEFPLGKDEFSEGRPPAPDGEFALLLVHKRGMEDWWSGIIDEIRLVEEGVVVIHTLVTPTETTMQQKARRTEIRCHSGVLLENLTAFLQAWNETGVPQCEVLTSSKTYSILSALAILCQGHLAVVAATDQEAEDEEVRKAIEQMGWTKLSDEIREYIGRTAKKQGALTATEAWWLGPFTAECKSRGYGGDPRRWMIDEARKEYGSDLPPRVEELLLFSRPLEPRTVACAYNALVKCLGVRG